jgi:hypothetical protein
VAKVDSRKMQGQSAFSKKLKFTKPSCLLLGEKLPQCAKQLLILELF